MVTELIMKRQADILLYDTEYLSLWELEDPECQYSYVHENKAAGGYKVAVLPYFQIPSGEVLYVGCYEKFHAFEPFGLCSITGSCEDWVFTHDPRQDAQRELQEEAGIIAPIEYFVPLGESISSKSMDTIYFLFAIDIGLPGCQIVEAQGDGSADEERAYCDYVTINQVADCKDPLLSTMVLRLLHSGELLTLV